VRPLRPELLEHARKLNHSLGQIAQPLGAVAAHLHSRLDKEAAELETATRVRIEAAVRGLERPRSISFIPILAFHAGHLGSRAERDERIR
jgi:hypothetical protein